MKQEKDTGNKIDVIVSEVLEFIRNAPEIETFIKTPKNQLYMFHHTLGQHIRNKYSLWEVYWEPEIKDGVDCSPNHPDNISMTIIKHVWDRLHNETI